MNTQEAEKWLKDNGFSNACIRIDEYHRPDLYVSDVLIKYAQQQVKNLNIPAVSGMLPLTKEHQCFELGHAFYLVCEIDNGRSKYGDHKCSRCGHVEPFQYDYGSW